MKHHIRTMRTRTQATALACVAAMLIPAQAWAQNADTSESADALSVRDVVREVARADADIVNSQRSVEEARRNYELTLAGTLPNLNLELTPYSYDQRRVPAGPTGEELTETHSAAAGVSLEQPLTTSGMLSAGVSNRFEITDGDSTTFAQRPQASLNYSQPIFVAGDFITTSVYQARLRNAEIGVERSLYGDRLTTNGNIQGALALFVQVSSLRRTIDVLEQTVDVLRRQLDAAEIDREQGLISDNALLALQVTLNDRRENLLNTELSLVEAEQDLARALGRDRLEAERLDERYEAPPVPDIDDVEAAVLDNPQVGIQELAVEQTQRSALLNDLTDRPRMNVAVRLAPLYPEQRDSPDDVATSFGDYFDSGADLEASVALDVTIPLLTRRERAAREAIDELGELREETNLVDTQRGVANQLQTLLTNRGFLSRRRELLEVDVQYERRRVANEEELLAAGATTELRLDEVELDLASRRNELRQIEAELFLNAVEIHAVLGASLPELLLD